MSQEQRARPLVVAVVGSEHAHGETTSVVARAGAWFRERDVDFEVIALAESEVLPCGPCGDCNVRPTPCAVDDDVARIVARLIAADGVIYATPVHAFGMSAHLQIFLERAGVGHLRFERPLEDKVGAAIVVGRRYGHLSVVAQIHHNMLLNRMVLVGSGFPAVLSTDGGRPALEDREGMEAVRAQVDRMCSALGRGTGTRQENS